MPELAFFVGKGGVGKTTVSAAYALRIAHQKPSGRVLLISTDPAHSLADVLQVRLRDSPASVRVNQAAKLMAWQMNPAALFRDFIREHKRHMLELVERGSLFTAEEVAPLLETALPGMSEVAGLLAIEDALRSGKYSKIVVDTAPFGHTLRLFQMPEQFERLLNFLDLAGSRDRVLAAHFGGRPQVEGEKFVSEWRGKLEQLQSAFRSAALFLVTTPESFALKESLRCVAELERSQAGMRLGAIVLNRAVIRAGKCRFCKKKAAAAKESESLLRKEFPEARIYVGQDGGFPVLGVRELKKFAGRVFNGSRLAQDRSTGPRRTARLKIALTATEWPSLRTPVTFVLGKGGVGKTTVSAGLSFRSREVSPDRVEICSVDPAPSLDEIFQSAVGDTPKAVLSDSRFRASELDSVSLFRKWVSEIKTEIESATRVEASGVHVDLSFERQLFSELLEIVPPGLDEVLAIFRIVELAQTGRARGFKIKVVVDMAPTGHALELMRTPERVLTWSRLLLKSLAAHRKLALAREAAVKIAELQMRARELASALKDSKRATIYGVTLPEPLPDRETERLLGELEKIGSPARAMFVNRVIFPEDARDCPRCMLTMKWQQSVLADLRRRYPKTEIFVVRNFADELVGRKGLKDLTGELWLLQ